MVPGEAVSRLPPTAELCEKSNPVKQFVGSRSSGPYPLVELMRILSTICLTYAPQQSRARVVHAVSRAVCLQTIEEGRPDSRRVFSRGWAPTPRAMESPSSRARQVFFGRASGGEFSGRSPREVNRGGSRPAGSKCGAGADRHLGRARALEAQSCASGGASCADFAARPTLGSWVGPTELGPKFEQLVRSFRNEPCCAKSDYSNDVECEFSRKRRETRQAPSFRVIARGACLGPRFLTLDMALVTRHARRGIGAKRSRDAGIEAWPPPPQPPADGQRAQAGTSPRPPPLGRGGPGHAQGITYLKHMMWNIGN